MMLLLVYLHRISILNGTRNLFLDYFFHVLLIRITVRLVPPTNDDIRKEIYTSQNLCPCLRMRTTNIRISRKISYLQRPL
jgi:hypothetical protein